MGKFRSSLLGKLRNHVAENLYQVQRGQNIVRNMPSHYTDKHSPSQMVNRLRFNTYLDFYNQNKYYITKGWQSIKTGYTVSNARMAYNFMKAMSYGGVFWDILYSQFVFFKGSLRNQLNFHITALPLSNLIQLTWDSTIQPGSNPGDLLLIQTYCPDIKRGYTDQSGQNRTAGNYTTNVPYAFQGHDVHVWINFYSVGQIYSSTTQYLGVVSMT